MNQPSTAREALIAELLGDIGALLDRVDALQPALDESRLRLTRSTAELAHQVDAAERHMAAITENAKAQAVKHIARRTDEMARATVDTQTRALQEAARKVFQSELGPVLQRLAGSLRIMTELVGHRSHLWDQWLTHAATATVASAGTLLVMHWLGQ